MSTCSSRDSRGFWAAVNGRQLNVAAQYGIGSSISPAAWLTHYQKVYALDKYLPSIQGDGDNLYPLEIRFEFEAVYKAIMDSPSNKAPGPDGIPIDLYNDEPHLWASVLVNVLNAVSQLGLPPTWKSATIVPVFKKGNLQDPACYRPISPLCSVCSVKVVGRIVLQRVEVWAWEKDIICPVQY